jgi:uncharacterized protein
MITMATGMMTEIIDAHTHISPEKKGFGVNHDASVKNLISSLDRAGVKRAIVLPIQGMVTNLFVSKACKEYPDRLIGFASVDPRGGKAAARKILAEMKRFGLKGVKLHPKRQQFSLSDDNVREFFKELDNIAGFRAFPMPVIIDSWFSDTDPEKIVDEVADFIRSTDFSNIKIILAHGGGFMYRKIMPLAGKDRKNVFVDTAYSFLTFKKHARDDCVTGFLGEMKNLGAAKVLFGTDFPECDIKESVDYLRELLKKNGFSAADEQMIFSENIKRILQI